MPLGNGRTDEEGEQVQLLLLPVPAIRRPHQQGVLEDGPGEDLGGFLRAGDIRSLRLLRGGGLAVLRLGGTQFNGGGLGIRLFLSPASCRGKGQTEGQDQGLDPFFHDFVLLFPVIFSSIWKERRTRGFYCRKNTIFYFQGRRPGVPEIENQHNLMLKSKGAVTE